jgi:hypothetical protein
MLFWKTYIMKLEDIIPKQQTERTTAVVQNITSGK